MEISSKSCTKPQNLHQIPKRLFKCQASQYPQVYLDATLTEKIGQANKYKNLSAYPKTRKRRKTETFTSAKRTNKEKLFTLRSVDSSFLKKICNQTGCSCCKTRSLSCEAVFEKLIEEKKTKTSIAKEDFQNIFRTGRKKAEVNSKHLSVSPKRTGKSFKFGDDCKLNIIKFLKIGLSLT
jgi:hypothetical protein